MSKQYVVGIDIGGQTSKLGVVDARGDVLSQTVIRTDTFGRDADAYIAALAEAVKSCVAQADMTMDDIRGIGVGAPNGNYYTGEVAFAPNLAWAADQAVPLSKKLSEACGVPVSLTNDANAAAVGEMAYGAARGMKNFIMITLGTGVGSGIVVDGKVLYGHDGFAGELGHTIAIRDGRQCNCGLKGCLETYCSAMGVRRTAQKILSQNPDKPSLLREVDFETISSKDVFDAASKGDEIAVEIFKTTGQILGRSLADFVKFSAPEAIVLFGGLAKAKKFFHDDMVAAMEENQLQIWKGRIKILYSSLKDSDAAILGASALAW